MKNAFVKNSFWENFMKIKANYLFYSILFLFRCIATGIVTAFRLHIRILLVKFFTHNNKNCFKDQNLSHGKTIHAHLNKLDFGV